MPLSGVAADGERAVGVHFGDGPEFAVAYGFAVVGGELSVVAAGGDDVADVGALAAADADAGRLVELAGANAGSLDGGVDGVDVVVRRGRDRDVLAVAGSVSSQMSAMRSRWRSKVSGTIRPWAS